MGCDAGWSQPIGNVSRPGGRRDHPSQGAKLASNPDAGERALPEVHPLVAIATDVVCPPGANIEAKEHP